jgi:hypothetical protein
MLYILNNLYSEMHDIFFLALYMTRLHKRMTTLTTCTNHTLVRCKLYKIKPKQTKIFPFTM